MVVSNLLLANLFCYYVRKHLKYWYVCSTEGSLKHRLVLWYNLLHGIPGGLFPNENIRHIHWNSKEKYSKKVVVFFFFLTDLRPVLSNTVTTSYVWLLSTWNVGNPNWNYLANYETNTSFLRLRMKKEI